MSKPTLKDVATEARVGVATVERVLNGRGNVSAATIERVIRAVRKLDYPHRLPEMHRGAIRIEVILVRPETAFFFRLNQAFERISATLDGSVLLHRTFVRESDPLGTAHYIETPSFRRSGLIICAQDHPRVADALRKARAAGVEVVQVVTRCDDPDVTYVGIDNYSAGRTAAFYLSGMLSARQGSLIAACHGRAYSGHRERIRGFSDYLQEKGSDRHVFTELLFAEDDDLVMVELLAQALKRDPDIIGLYTASGDDGGVAKLLASLGRDRDLLWVAHELTDEKKRHLSNGTLSFVLDQAPEMQARRAVDLILRRLGMLNAEVSAEPVRFLTITPENL